MATETPAAPAEEPVKEVEKPEETKPDKTYLEMSDEDFLKISAPPEVKKEEKKTEEADEPDKADTTDTAEKADDDTPPEEGAADKESPEASSKGASKEPSPQPPTPAPSGSKAKAGEADSKAEPEKKADEPPDYEGFFKTIMTPFKANGKTFEVKTPEEAVRLMQKGAGYGRKLQDMQPHLKVLRMLEKNNLLDESKLSYLIDLNLKKPDAIKKLIKDGGIDPLDLNTDDKVTYTPTNHAVTDQEVVFHQTLAEVQAQPGGYETLRTINTTWDQESKALLWESPELFTVIQTQRENGVYDQIAAEIDRQKLLGLIEQKTPFLQAYKIAGDHLVKTNGFKQPIQTQQSASNGNAQQPQVIATRTAVPKAQAQNGDRAAAASPTKTAVATKPTLTVNPLEMADDDFMKQFNGRF